MYLTRIRDLISFFFIVLQILVFKDVDCAAPDLTHGGKLGMNPFLSFVPFSFFFPERGPGNSDSRGRFHLLGKVGPAWCFLFVSGIWIVLILVVDGRRGYIVVSPTCKVL